MNRNNTLICVVALLLFPACQKEESDQPMEKDAVLSASIEQQVLPSSTKTVLASDLSVEWKADDAIKVFDNMGNSIKLVAESAGTSSRFVEPAVSAKDIGFSDIAMSCGIYPYSSGASYDTSNGSITFSLPETQIYEPNSFGQDANVTVGVVTDDNIDFKNVCGVLRLQLKGGASVKKVKKIVLTGKEYLWGTFSVNPANAGTTGASYVSGGGTSLTLDCSHYGETSLNAGDGGVELNSGSDIDFNIIVPVGAFASGFTVTIYDIGDTYSTNTPIYGTVTATATNTIVRSQIKEMPVKIASLLTSDFAELEYLKSTNTEKSYINSGWNADNNSGFEVKFNPKGEGTWEQLFSARETDHHRQFGMNWNKAKSDYAFSNTGRFEHAANSTSITEENRQNNCELSFDSVNVVKYINNQFASAKGKVQTVSPGTYEAYGPVYIFALNQGGEVSEYGTADLYYLKFYDGSTLARYFIPAKVTASAGVTDVNGNNAPQNTLGLFDVVNRKFYQNAGSGSFTAGTVLTN